MEHARFEWDDTKAAANIRAHNISFPDATLVFDDQMAIADEDRRRDYGERRINRIGMVDGVILHVTYTPRGERIRIISARQANRHERAHYLRKNEA